MVDTPAVEEPFSPASGRTNPADKKTWFGHPRELARLFTTEMWERFGYYGMRALLTLYLTKHFLFSDQQATGLYGGYTALVYLTPLVGGFIADQYLGSKRSIKFGAILMAIGYFTLAFGGSPAKPYAEVNGHRYEVVVDNFVDRPTSDPNEARFLVENGQKLQIRGNEDGSVSLLNSGQEAKRLPKGSIEFGGERDQMTLIIMLVALSLVSVGNGFFKPNISTIVGALYDQGDRRRDAGFTIFYMGINLGSIGGQLLCPFLADWFGWWAGLSLAGVGMLISYALIQFDGGRLAGYGERPETAKNRDITIYICALLAVPVFVFLFSNLMNATEAEAGSGFIGYIASLPLMGKLLFGTFIVAVPGILAWSFAKGTKQEAQMMTAAMILIVFNVFFWTLFEQAGSSLTLFADRNTDRDVFGLFTMSAPQTQNFNPISIVVFAPLMSLLWLGLAKRGLEPSIPVKFSIALMGVGAGFLFLVLGTTFAGPENNWQVGLWWLAGLYLIHSLAELCISPVGLSMITKLSIARVVGLMMGVWFLSISVAQYVAGVVAQFASVETVGGQVTNLKVSLDTYTSTFTTIAWIAIGAGVVLFLLSWPLQKWMHGVK
ncbi:peptide MFS transporter [Sphingomonas sediminicola]|jgi:POT family proton-dependent oligopeptide transporter|uniref:Peptide MFS transporter n=1 Tax=Sphingomonas sediminicola TaxID=386874 RepID=A0ABX6TB89_9SPHN|nr:peptide MFS transporter [Sphingomonas sediminicola]QNP46513.1 peptide MFS transporter [Sphingomonas sediminicola]